MSESTESTLTIDAKYGRVRTHIQLSILVVVAFIGGYLVLYSDRHNDERYISKVEYAKDRAADKEFRDLSQSVIISRLDQQDKKLDEVSQDVKSLLRKTPEK